MRRLAIIVAGLVSVAGFGLSIIVFALSTNFFLSFVALFFSGLTDGISMIIRSVILRVMSPEHLRGRIASVNWIFIGASNEIGAFGNPAHPSDHPKGFRVMSKIRTCRRDAVTRRR